MLKADVLVETRSGALGEHIAFSIVSSKVVMEAMQAILIHISVPAFRWCVDVKLTSATTLMFQTESEVDRWCKRTGYSRGFVIPLDKAWELARLLYSDWGVSGFHDKMVHETEKIFQKLGLVGDFWNLRA